MEDQELNGKEDLQLVVFTIDTGEYAFNILDVHEIIRLAEITRVPRTPAYVEGVINLRGNVIPVIDLHKRLGLPAGKPTDKTRIVIVQVQGIKAGMIVDEVLEVLQLSSQDVEPAPAARDNTEFLQGVGKVGDRLLLLVDLERLLGLSQIAS